MERISGSKIPWFSYPRPRPFTAIGNMCGRGGDSDFHFPSPHYFCYLIPHTQPKDNRMHTSHSVYKFIARDASGPSMMTPTFARLSVEFGPRSTGNWGGGVFPIEYMPQSSTTHGQSIDVTAAEQHVFSFVCLFARHFPGLFLVRLGLGRLTCLVAYENKSCLDGGGPTIIGNRR